MQTRTAVALDRRTHLEGSARPAVTRSDRLERHLASEQCERQQLWWPTSTPTTALPTGQPDKRTAELAEVKQLALEYAAKTAGKRWSVEMVNVDAGERTGRDYKAPPELPWPPFCSFLTHESGGQNACFDAVQPARTTVTLKAAPFCERRAV